MTTNIDGAIITPKAAYTIRFLQEETNIDDVISQINEIIDIVLAEDIPLALSSDKDCIRIVRNLRYLAQHLSTFKAFNHE